MPLCEACQKEQSEFDNTNPKLTCYHIWVAQIRKRNEARRKVDQANGGLAKYGCDESKIETNPYFQHK